MNLNKLPRILLIMIGLLFALNILFLDWRVIGEGREEKQEVGNESGEVSGTEEAPSLSAKVATDSCGLVCQETITARIQEELGKLTPQAGQSSVSQIPIRRATTPTIANGKPKVVYFPLVTDGTVTSINWTDIVPSEFYFDLENYPNAKEVRFEAYLLSLNNDLVTARLYDQTNKRAVDFSDLQTKESTFTRAESSGISIWQGNNKYTVQLRSVNGTQVQLKDAKIKIIYQ